MKNSEYFYISIGLHKDRDRRLIDWLNKQPNRTIVIREALIEIMQNRQNQLTEILDIVRDLQSRPIGIISTNGDVLQSAEQVEETEPQDVAKSLDDLWR